MEEIHVSYKKALKYLKSYLKNKDIVRFYLYVDHEQAC